MKTLPAWPINLTTPETKGDDVMALICNVQPQVEIRAPNAPVSGESSNVDLDHERFIESGSAYFAQAFAEVLGLVSDLELHDPRGAELKLRSMAFLLDRALEQYEAAVEFESQTGLSESHERKLREAGLDLEGVRQVLSEAQTRRLLSGGDERIEILATTFDRMGYPGLMSLYIGMVREIHDLVTVSVGTEEPGNDGVAWQELGWKLTTLFAQTLEVGQAIAILNIFTFRLQRSR